MARKPWLLLLILGFIVAWIGSRPIGSPGYMDADYYFAMSTQWAQGAGSQEPFLWNYLSEPDAIPTVSHSYWSPLTSLISATSMLLLGDGFRNAQLPYVVFTALLPVLTWKLALSLGSGSREALLSGLLALSPGYFLPYFLTTDMFSLYACLGVGILLLLVNPRIVNSRIGWVAIGVLCGLAHLCRVDGVVLLVLPLGLLAAKRDKVVSRLGFLAVGYCLVMVPWFYRNYVFVGTILNPAGGRSLWLLSYDEIFSYPASLLRPARWWGAGLDQLLRHRWGAMTLILQRMLAENGLVFLAPFMVIGLRKLWHHAIVRSTIIYFVLIFVLMVFVFPFAGARGGWFHASAAGMTLLWVAAPIGLNDSIGWLGRKRGWNIPHARTIFSGTMVLLAFAFTWGLYLLNVIGSGQPVSIWNLPHVRYEAITSSILELDPDAAVVVVNNPPGLFHASGLKAIALPNGDPSVLKEAVDQFGASWIVIDSNHPQLLAPLFDGIAIPAWMHLEKKLELFGENFLLYRVSEA